MNGMRLLSSAGARLTMCVLLGPRVATPRVGTAL